MLGDDLPVDKTIKDTTPVFSNPAYSPFAGRNFTVMLTKTALQLAITYLFVKKSFFSHMRNAFQMDNAILDIYPSLGFT